MQIAGHRQRRLVPEHPRRVGGADTQRVLQAAGDLTRAVQREDRPPDLGDRGVEVVDHRQHPLLHVGPVHGRLEVQAGGEQSLDDAVVEVASDAVAVVGDLHLGMRRGQFGGDALLVREVVEHQDEAPAQLGAGDLRRRDGDVEVVTVGVSQRHLDTAATSNSTAAVAWSGHHGAGWVADSTSSGE